MKNLFAKTMLVVAVIFFITGCSNTPGGHKGEIAIKEAVGNMENKDGAAAHRPFDISVTYTAMGDSEKAYQVVYYQTENNAVNRHGAMWGSKEKYDSAAYQWLDDTTVSIRLINSANKKVEAFKVYGNGPRNGLLDK